MKAKKARAPAAKQTAGRKGSKSRSGRGPITPDQALANTRTLLDAKHQHDRRAQPWQTLDPGHSHVPQPGFQSGEAAANALDLHAGEARIKPIQGSISTHVRKDQGRRDKG